MPPLYRPPLRTGKQPPVVLPRELAGLVNLNAPDAWPSCLALPAGAGLECVTLAMCHGLEAANACRLISATAGVPAT